MRKRAFICSACGKTVRPRARKSEAGPRYYTQSDWFLIDALRRGELTPGIIWQAVAARPEEDVHSDPSVMRACDETIETLAEEITSRIGRNTTSDDILQDYFAARIAQSPFTRYRFAEYLHLTSRDGDAADEIARAIYAAGSNVADPLVPPAWLRLFEVLHGRPFARPDLDRAARLMGFPAATDDAWGALGGPQPAARLMVDFFSSPPDYELECRACGSKHEQGVGADDDRITCADCRAWLGTRWVLRQALDERRAWWRENSRKNV